MERLNDVVETYYDNGKLKSRASYKDGKLDGLAEWWHSNCQPWKKETYKDGVVVY